GNSPRCQPQTEPQSGISYPPSYFGAISRWFSPGIHLAHWCSLIFRWIPPINPKETFSKKVAPVPAIPYVAKTILTPQDAIASHVRWKITLLLAATIHEPL